MFLLLLIVSRISNVHSVVGWKPGVGHTLLTSSGSIMVGRDTLSEQAGITGIRALLGLLGHRLALLGHLDGSPVVLLVLMGMVHPAISQVRDIGIGEVRTHATILSLLAHLFSPPHLLVFSFCTLSANSYH